MLSIAIPSLAQDSTTTSSSPTLRELVEQSRMRMQQQQMMAMPTNPMGMPMATMAAPMSGPMTPTSMAALAALSPQDQLFMVRAAEGNLAEITLAQLALQKSKTPEVKNVAQTIITGHTQAQNDLMSRAMAKGIQLMPMLSPTHVAVSEKLKKAKGADFDKMYMANQTDDHENTIALFQTEVANGTDTDAKAHAQQFLPDIVGHTIMIYTVAKQVGAPGSELRPASPPVPPGVTPTMMPMPGTMPSM